MAHAMEITPDARAPCTCTCMPTLHPPPCWDLTKRPRRWLACDLFLHSFQRPSHLRACTAARQFAGSLSIVRPSCGSDRVSKWYRARKWVATRNSASSETACRGACHLGDVASLGSGRVRAFRCLGPRDGEGVLLSVPLNWAIYNVLTVLTTGSYFIRKPFQRCRDHHYSGRWSGVCLLI